MKYGIHVILICCMGLILRACIEPFDPGLPGNMDFLVVDGLITDQAEPNLVKISRSFSYNEKSFFPEKGCVVSILSESGASWTLEEKDPGHYYTDTLEFMGEAGRAYQLHILLADGKEYLSDFVVLKEAPPIQSMKAVYEQRETADPELFMEGVQVYLSTGDPTNATRYYRWEWEETWEYTVPMRIPDADIYRCWKKGTSASILVSSSDLLEDDRIIDFPIHYVSSESNRLKLGYSLEVMQYAVSQASYEFWNLHEEQAENAGTLFDPIPSAIPGNIYSQSDPPETVLGFFEASGVSRDRIFFNKDLLPARIDIPSDFEYCKFQILTNPSPSDITYLITHGWVYVDDYTERNDTIVRLTNHKSCMDCTLSGSNQRPEYWPPNHESQTQ